MGRLNKRIFTKGADAPGAKDMHRHVSAAIVASFLLLPFSAAQATIQSDQDAGLSFSQIINNALNDDISFDEILATLIKDCQPENQPEACNLDEPLEECKVFREDERAQTCDLKAPLKECNPIQFAEDFKKLRFKQFVVTENESCGGDALQAIGQAAINNGITEEQLTQSALNNGIDPTTILPPTRAGNPARTGFTLPPFGGDQGGGGGSTASPN